MRLPQLPPQAPQGFPLHCDAEPAPRESLIQLVVGGEAGSARSACRPEALRGHRRPPWVDRAGRRAGTPSTVTGGPCVVRSPQAGSQPEECHVLAERVRCARLVGRPSGGPGRGRRSPSPPAPRTSSLPPGPGSTSATTSAGSRPCSPVPVRQRSVSVPHTRQRSRVYPPSCSERVSQSCSSSSQCSTSARRCDVSASGAPPCAGRGPSAVIPIPRRAQWGCCGRAACAQGSATSVFCTPKRGGVR